MRTKHKAETNHDVSDEVSDVPVEEKKTATEPWKAENAPDSARKRGLLGLSKSKEGHQVRWVRYDAIDRRKNQGYVLATPEDFDAMPDENGMIRRNELVLMVVPTEIYDQRRAEVAKLTADQTRAPKREYLRERAAASRQSGHDLGIKDRESDEE